MSRFLKALQRMEVEHQQWTAPEKVETSRESPASASIGPGNEGPLPERGPSTALALSAEQVSPANNVSFSPNSSTPIKGLPGTVTAREPLDLETVIERLRLRALPGREPGYCQMAAHILSQLPPGPSAVFLFLSLPGDPTTTGALAPLAAVLGEALPAPVLGLDARSDRAELAECFGLACRWTLAEVLAGQTPIYEAVRKTPIGELFLLAGGASERMEWANISEESWAGLMGQLRKHYRLILIDGGQHPHPGQKVLLDQCDGVYLVVHLGRTPKRLLHTVVADLQQAGACVLGCIAAGSGRNR